MVSGSEPDWTALREEFPILAETIYLNTCSLGALSRRATEANARFLQLWGELGASAWYQIWLGEVAALRTDIARLLNAPASAIALAPNVGVALASIASSIDYTLRPKVIVTALDFPTIAYQWLVRPEVEVVILPSDDGISIPLERYAEAIDERTALVATSHVFFTSGFIQPIAEIARLAHARGALMVVDGYQAAGQIPVDVRALDVDAYVTGGLKWLLGGPGIVELYVRPELIEKLRPTQVGWFGHRRQFAFETEHFDYQEDARRFEVGTPAMAAVYAARAGLSYILELGVETIRARELALVADLVGRLCDTGFALKLPASLAEHAGIVMVRAGDPAAVVRALAQRRVIVDYRPGFVRISPFFYNTEEENERIVAAMQEIRVAER